MIEWYENLPNGLETMVGEKEIKLSAGQKQRLNIIRGILIDKDLCNKHYKFENHMMKELITI